MARSTYGEFAELEALSVGIPYAALDLDYLREASHKNRSFAYVVSYDTFILPERDEAGEPCREEPTFLSVVKLGDGGRQDGRSPGAASGSIISRVVHSYWDDTNVYRAELQGVVVPGNDTNISRKIEQAVGGRKLKIKGDVWRKGLLDCLSTDELLRLLEADPAMS